jgi:hypothetical protein
MQKILRLWRGELGLFQSYWFWFMGLNIILSISIKLIADIFLPSGLAVAAFFAYIILVVTYGLISCVGVWRAAYTYKKNEWCGPLAQLAVLINAYKLISEVVELSKAGLAYPFISGFLILAVLYFVNKKAREVGAYE